MAEQVRFETKESMRRLTTQYLAGDEHAHRARKDGYEDHGGHPDHPDDVGRTTTEAILSVTVDGKTDELTADGRVGQGCLPFRYGQGSLVIVEKVGKRLRLTLNSHHSI